MWRSSRFCPWPYTFYHVHHLTKYTKFISIAQSSPVCRRHTAFLLFYPPDLHSSISHLQTALQEICSWMTANLLTLNSSETEFLLIGLKQQLAKIQNCPLSTTHSARNLGFISDEHCTLPSHALTILQGPKCPGTSRQTLKRAPSFHAIEHCRRESSTFHRSGLHIFFFRPDNCIFQVLQLPRSSTPVYQPIP